MMISTMGKCLIGALAVAAWPGAIGANIQSTASIGDAAGRCARLTGSTIEGAKIDRAEFIASGTTLPPVPGNLKAGICRVSATISVVQGSEIKLQVWMPETWNGKFVGLGGGGFEGGLGNAGPALTKLSQEGYAGVATNAGHSPSIKAEWALGNPEKIVDFAHRANHLGAVVGKATAAAFYGQPVKRSLFNGCSNGGRDALMLAQRYPADYDAIVAGAPANNWTGLMSWFARHEQIARLSPGADLLGPKLELIHAAAMRKCDAIDGVKDGLIERPTACKFDPVILQCKAGSSTDCLSKAEVQAVRALYRDVRTRTGLLAQPGLPVGSEYEWSYWLASVKSGGADFARQFYRYMVYQDPNWDIDRFDISRDFPFARKNLGPILDAVNPDLRPFLNRGGRLLMYHGWDDAAIPAGNTLNYYAAMRRTVGRAAAERTRLFMLPGVAHCAGGNGPSNVDYLGALDQWAESGVAPERLVAAKADNMLRYMVGLPTKVMATRPVCAWPKAARYKGAGPVNEADSYVCR